MKTTLFISRGDNFKSLRFSAGATQILPGLEAQGTQDGKTTVYVCLQRGYF